jgi:acyl-coenzyme A synthetase/AMP-(fatty) acid ligase
MAPVWDPNKNIGLESSLGVLKQVADAKLGQVLERQQYRQNQQRAQEQRSELEQMLIASNVNPQDAKFISAIPTKDWGKVIPKLMQQQGAQQQQQQ